MCMHASSLTFSVQIVDDEGHYIYVEGNIIHAINTLNAFICYVFRNGSKYVLLFSLGFHVLN